MTKQVLQQALEALIWECGSEPALYAPKTAEAIESLREALAQQPELSTASKSEQLLASHDHALRAEFQRMKEALAQQGEQQPEPDEAGHIGFQEWWDSVADEYEVNDFKKMRRAWNASLEYAPAAQPTWTDDGGWTFPIERPAQPLTDEQIEEMHEEQDFIATLFQVKRIVRAAELAHGIGEKK